MPTIECRTRVKAVSDSCTLALSARHRLVAGNPSDTIFTANKTRFPEDVDVLLTSNLVVTLSGTLDRVKVNSEVMKSSQLAHHLASYLQTNATELGLNTVSGLYVDKVDDMLKLTLTSSRCLLTKPERLPVHVNLVALILDYCWTTIHRSESPTVIGSASTPLVDPFSPNLSLPFKSLLDNVVGRFTTWHLVRRYPLIFGPWCQQLDVEVPFFPTIFRSVLNIMERSPNSTFRAHCRRLIKTIKQQHSSAHFAASSSLQMYLGSILDSASSPETAEPRLTDEEALCLSMERLYRKGTRRPQFKGLSGTIVVDVADDEELSQDQSLLPTEPGHAIANRTLWDELPSREPNVNHRQSHSPCLDKRILTSPSSSMAIDLTYSDTEKSEDEPFEPAVLDFDSADDSEDFCSSSHSLSQDFCSTPPRCVPSVLDFAESLSSPAISLIDSPKRHQDGTGHDISDVEDTLVRNHYIHEWRRLPSPSLLDEAAELETDYVPIHQSHQDLSMQERSGDLQGFHAVIGTGHVLENGPVSQPETIQFTSPLLSPSFLDPGYRDQDLGDNCEYLNRGVTLCRVDDHPRALSSMDVYGTDPFDTPQGLAVPADVHDFSYAHDDFDWDLGEDSDSDGGIYLLPELDEKYCNLEEFEDNNTEEGMVPVPPFMSKLGGNSHLNSALSTTCFLGGVVDHLQEECEDGEAGGQQKTACVGGALDVRLDADMGPEAQECMDEDWEEEGLLLMDF